MNDTLYAIIKAVFEVGFSMMCVGTALCFVGVLSMFIGETL